LAKPLCLRWQLDAVKKTFFKAVHACIPPSMCDHILSFTNACGSFTKFSNEVQLGTKMNRLGFGVRSRTVKVMARPNMTKKAPNFGGHGFKGQGHSQPFQQRHSDNMFRVGRI